MQIKPIYLYMLPLLLAAAGCVAGAPPGEAHDDGHHHTDGEATEVVLSQAQIETVGIRLGSMERREMADALQATGVIEADPQGEAVASARLPGTLSRICVAVGQKVSAGQAVAYVNAPELVELRTQRREAEQEVAAARRELERQEALAAQGAGVRKNLDAARSALTLAETRLGGADARLRAYGATQGDMLTVAAPISGTVTAVEAAIGEYADAQSPIVRIVNNSGVYCRLDVLEKDLGRVSPGLPVALRLTNDPSVEFSGTVKDVAPALDAQTRTVGVVVGLDRPGTGDAILLPGMAVTAQVSARGEAVDALPEGAVVSAGGKHYIFVLEEEPDGESHEGHAHEGHDHDGDHDHEGEGHSHEGEGGMHFRKVEVVTGITAFGYTAVKPLEPLAADARIVVAGAFYLNSMTSDHGEHNH